MTITQFNDLLRNLLRRRPFEPIEISLEDGRQIIIDRPDAVSMDGGAAGFIAADGNIHFFNSVAVHKMGTISNGFTPKP